MLAWKWHSDGCTQCRLQRLVAAQWLAIASTAGSTYLRPRRHHSARWMLLTPSPHLVVDDRIAPGGGGGLPGCLLAVCGYRGCRRQWFAAADDTANGTSAVLQRKARVLPRPAVQKYTEGLSGLEPLMGSRIGPATSRQSCRTLIAILEHTQHSKLQGHKMHYSSSK
jgi:hypothetical protein